MKNKRHLCPSLCAAMFLIWVAAPAFSCPSGQYEVCAIGCFCVPNSGQVADAVTRPITETAIQGPALALEAWITQSRNSAIGGAGPMPFAMRDKMRAYYSDDILNRVKFKVGDNGVINAARAMMQNGDVLAVTLIDVVVFRNGSDAMSNAPLWAHELRHVQQYKEWGVHDFAVRYVRNSNAVENEAYAIEKIVATDVAQQPIAAPTQPVIAPIRYPAGAVTRDCGCYGYNPVAAAADLSCASGAVSLFVCNQACPNGGNQYGYVCQ